MRLKSQQLAMQQTIILIKLETQIENQITHTVLSLQDIKKSHVRIHNDDSRMVDAHWIRK